MLLKYTRTLAVRGVGSFLSVFALYFVTNSFGVELSSAFLFGISLLGWLVVLSSSGFGIFILKNCSEITYNKESELSTSTLFSALAYTVLVSFFIVIPISISFLFFLKYENIINLLPYLISLPFVNSVILVSFFFQAKSRNEMSAFLQNIILWFVFILSFSSSCYVGIFICSVDYLPYIYLFSSFLSAVFSFSFLFYVYDFSSFSFLKFDGYFDTWIYQVLMSFVSLGGIVLSKSYLDDYDFSLLGLSARLSFSINILVVIANSVISPIFSRAFTDNLSLSTLYRQAHRYMLFVSLSLLIFLILSSDFLMVLFGDGYSNSGYLLLTLSIPHLVNLSCGPIYPLLNMTNKNLILRNTNLLIFFLFVMFFVLFAHMASVTWFAVSISVMISLQSLIPYFYCRFKKLI